MASKFIFAAVFLGFFLSFIPDASAATLILPIALGYLGGMAGTAIGYAAIGAAVGQIAGVIIGQMIDTALFPSSKSKAVNDVKDPGFSGATEGSVIPLIYGTMRVPGTFIWMSEKRSEKAYQKGGGGKKGGSKVAYDKYFRTAAIAFAVGPVQEIKRIFINNEVVEAGQKKVQFVRRYNGTETQDPDPSIVAAEGPNIPAFLGTAYIVLEYELGQGEAFPQNIQAEVVGFVKTASIKPITDATFVGANVNAQSQYVSLGGRAPLNTKEGISYVGFTNYASNVANASKLQVSDVALTTTSASVVVGPEGPPGRITTLRHAVSQTTNKILIVYQAPFNATDTGYNVPSVCVYDRAAKAFGPPLTNLTPNGGTPGYWGWLGDDKLCWVGTAFVESGLKLVVQRFNVANNTLTSAGPLSVIGTVPQRGPDGNIVLMGGSLFKITSDVLNGFCCWMNYSSSAAKAHFYSFSVMPNETTAPVLAYESYNTPNLSSFYASNLSILQVQTDYKPSEKISIIERDAQTYTSEAHAGAITELTVIRDIVRVRNTRRLRVPFNTNNNLRCDGLYYVHLAAPNMSTAAVGQKNSTFTGKTDLSISTLAGTPILPGLDGVIPTASDALIVPGVKKVLFQRVILQSGVPSTFVTLYDSQLETSQTVGGIIRDTCLRAGLTDAQIDTAQVDTDEIIGQQVADNNGRNVIDPLAMYSIFAFVQSGGVLRAQKIHQEPVVSVPPEHLDWRADGEDPVGLIQRTRMPPTELPREVAYSYIDPAKDFQRGTVYARRQTDVSTENSVSVDVPLVMTKDRAEDNSRIHLSRVWSDRDSIEVRVPLEYLFVDPGDSVVVNGVKMLVKTVAINGHQLVWKGSPLHGRFPQAENSIGTMPSGKLAYKPDSLTLVEPLDLPPLLDVMDGYGINYVVKKASLDLDWPGAHVLTSTDDFVSHDDEGAAPGLAVMGTTIGALADGSPYYLDQVGTVDVVLTEGSLSSTTEDDMLNGANTALVGHEIVGFTKAQLIAAKTYRLSGLWRGRYGTEAFSAFHVAGERFIVLNQATLGTILLQPTDIGREIEFKGVSNGTTVESAEAVPTTPRGATMRPLAPTAIVSSRQANGDVAASWSRRARVKADWLDFADVALDEPFEGYIVKIYKNGTVLKEFEVNAEGFTYAQNDIVSDFQSLPSSIMVSVAQISSRVGPGLEKFGILSTDGSKPTAAVQTQLAALQGNSWRNAMNQLT